MDGDGSSSNEGLNMTRDTHFGPRLCCARWLAGCAFALLTAVSIPVNAACKLSDIDQAHGDRIAYRVDESRNRLETIALSHSSISPTDALGSRLAWDETEQALSYYSTLKIISDLNSKMSTAADRAAVASEFSEMAGTTAKAVQKTAQYLTIFSTKARDAAVATEAAQLRDEIREFANLFGCADAS